MFNMGMTEMLIIAAIGLIVIGPTKLPGVMRAIGRGLAEFRKASNEFKNTVTREFEEATGSDVKEISNMANTLKRKNMASSLESYLDTAASVIEGGSKDNKPIEIEEKKKEPEDSSADPEKSETILKETTD